MSEEEKVPTDDELGAGEVVEPTEPQETAGNTETETPAEEAEKPDKGMVPHGALHEEREKRKALEARYATLEERTNLLFQQKQEEDAALEQWKSEPEWNDDDPASQKAWLESRFDSIEKPISDYRAERQAEQQQQAIESKYQSDFAAATGGDEAKVGEFNGAMNHWMGSLRSYYTTAGVPEHAAQGMVARDYQSIVAGAAQTGRNAAQVIYEAAKAFGYQGVPKQDAAQEIEQTNRSQSAAKSLSSVGGKPPANLTAAAIADMSEEEFSQLKESDWKALMG